jgi:hypothetical protein
VENGIRASLDSRCFTNSLASWVASWASHALHLWLPVDDDGSVSGHADGFLLKRSRVGPHDIPLRASGRARCWGGARPIRMRGSQCGGKRATRTLHAPVERQCHSHGAQLAGVRKGARSGDIVTPLETLAHAPHPVCTLQAAAHSARHPPVAP